MVFKFFYYVLLLKELHSHQSLSLVRISNTIIVGSNILGDKNQVKKEFSDRE